jgi:hypothetical protein
MVPVVHASARARRSRLLGHAGALAALLIKVPSGPASGAVIKAPLAGHDEWVDEAGAVADRTHQHGWQRSRRWPWPICGETSST